MEYLRRAEEIRAIFDNGGNGPKGAAAAPKGGEEKEGNDAKLRAAHDYVESHLPFCLLEYILAFFVFI